MQNGMKQHSFLRMYDNEAGMMQIQPDALLAMMVSASDQEIAGGDEGWVKPPEEYAEMASDLVDEGWVERKGDWFRPTQSGRDAIAPGRMQ